MKCSEHTLISQMVEVAAVCRAEWIKLRSLRFPPFALLGALVLTVAFTAVVAASVAASRANGYDTTASPATLAADAVTVGQLPVLIIGITLMTDEYTRSAIQLSLRGTPLRGRLLLAKTLVGGLCGLVVGCALATVGMLTARLLLGSAGHSETADTVHAVLGAGAYLALVVALMVGIGTVTRGTVLAILSAVVLLLAIPVLAEVASTTWLGSVGDYLPSTAGEALRTPGEDRYGPGAALLILAAWTAASQLLAYITLWARDA